VEQNEVVLEVETRLNDGRYVPRPLIRLLVDQLRACQEEVRRLALIVMRGNSHDDPGDGGSRRRRR
jgi:hypothetical protein